MNIVTRIILALAFVAVLCPFAAAQVLMENHYKVYDATPMVPWGFEGSLSLHDQFGNYVVQNVHGAKFATPVMKNQEPILFPGLGQTWYDVNFPTPNWDVEIDNQFGIQVWHVSHARYLVLPARIQPPHNHYLAYEATGPSVNIPVQLTDQFGVVNVVVAEPQLFLNPVEKVVNGVVYPIIDDVVHLACYRIDPPMTSNGDLVFTDQFDDNAVMLDDHRWLCVPSYKRLVVATQQSTWGSVKALYHN